MRFSASVSFSALLLATIAYAQDEDCKTYYDTAPAPLLRITQAATDDVHPVIIVTKVPTKVVTPPEITGMCDDILRY